MMSEQDSKKFETLVSSASMFTQPDLDLHTLIWAARRYGQSSQLAFECEAELLRRGEKLLYLTSGHIWRVGTAPSFTEAELQARWDELKEQRDNGLASAFCRLNASLIQG